MMTTQENSMAWHVDGPDPVEWPGKNYELLSETPGFVLPNAAVELLCRNVNEATPWRSECPERPNVEELYTLKCDKLPFEVRARLGGDGAHQESDMVQYVLEFKYLLGEQTDGRYGSQEIARGSMEKIANEIARLEPVVQALNFNFCLFKTNNPILPDLSALAEVISRFK